MIQVDIIKAKEITHNIRRKSRDEAFKPLDAKVIIPMYADAAEKERQLVREYYAVIQEDIDKAKSVEELKELYNTCAVNIKV